MFMIRWVVAKGQKAKDNPGSRKKEIRTAFAGVFPARYLRINGRFLAAFYPVLSGKGFSYAENGVIIQRFFHIRRLERAFLDGHFAHFLFVAMDLHELLDKTVTGLGYELVDIEQSPRGRILRVFIDKPEKEGGVDVEDCALVSNQLSRVLAVENIDYERLEISSPGLDRVLKKLADFERFTGSEINLRLRLPLAGRRNFNGVLRGVQDGKVCLTMDTGDVELELANVDKARLVPKFDR